MEIVRGRTWVQWHTVMDTEEGPLSDLFGITFKSQIREKTAVRNSRGIFEHALVVDVTVDVEDSSISMSLTRAQTSALAPGEYLIDLVGTSNSNEDESYLGPEPIRVCNRPTTP